MKFNLLFTLALVAIVAATYLALTSAEDNLTTTPSTVQKSPSTWRKLPNMLMNFASYRKVYRKAYASYIELMRRSQLFYARLARVFAVGIKYLRGQSTSFLRPNQYTDRTEEERMKIFNVAQDKVIDSTKKADKADQLSASKSELSEESESSNFAESVGVRSVDMSKLERIPPVSLTREQIITEGREGHTEIYLDYRQCIAPVKNQRECAACYMFSMLAIYEYQYCKQHQQQQVQFSEQYGIDCGKREVKTGGLNGCNGGLEDHVVHFVANYGLEFESKFPYKSKDDTCPYEPGTDKQRMGRVRVNHTEVASGTEAVTFEPGVLEYVLKKFGPFALAVCVDKDLVEYGGGIGMMSSCVKPYGQGTVVGGHAMTVVGHGIEEGHEYFLIRNSMGTDWGEQGYYRMSKHYNRQCVAGFTYIQAEFSENREKSANELMTE